MGDILMVTDFHKNAPQFRFVERQNVVPSIDVEKTTAESFYKAISKAMQVIESHGFLVIDCTSYADKASIPGHYVLFWELQKRGNHDVRPELDTLKMEECCAVVEQSLDSVYRMLRNPKRNFIGPLQIRVVKLGTFKAVMEFFVSQGTSIAQYKTPKCIENDKVIQILNSGVVGRFFSKCAAV